MDGKGRWIDNEWKPPGAVTGERRVRLKPLLEAGIPRFTYLYDFGDQWGEIDPNTVSPTSLCPSSL